MTTKEDPTLIEHCKCVNQLMALRKELAQAQSEWIEATHALAHAKQTVAFHANRIDSIKSIIKSLQERY